MASVETPAYDHAPTGSFGRFVCACSCSVWSGAGEVRVLLTVFPLSEALQALEAVLEDEAPSIVRGSVDGTPLYNIQLRDRHAETHYPATVFTGGTTHSPEMNITIDGMPVTPEFTCPTERRQSASQLEHTSTVITKVDGQVVSQVDLPTAMPINMTPMPQERHQHGSGRVNITIDGVPQTAGGDIAHAETPSTPANTPQEPLEMAPALSSGECAVKLSSSLHVSEEPVLSPIHYKFICEPIRLLSRHSHCHSDDVLRAC